MKIGPVDIRNHNFSKKMRGVDDAEVRAYLDLLADRLEETIREAAELRETVDRANQEIREYRAMEKTLRDSLVSADRVTEERLSLAEREARLIVKNAEVEAEKLLALSRETGARYRADLEDLRRQRTTFLERFRALLSSQSKILEASARDFNALDDITPNLPATATRSGSPPPSAPPAPAVSGASGLAFNPAPAAAPPPLPAPSYGAPPTARPDFRGAGISVPFEPVSSRIFEIRPENRPHDVHDPRGPEPRPPDSVSELAASYRGEEGLFATPPGEAAFGEGRPD